MHGGVARPIAESTRKASLSSRLECTRGAVINRLDHELLVAWFAEHGRSYPWRATKDPYLILIAAFMLQRTGVSQVMNVYPAFVARYPDFAALSRANPAELSRLLRPLGRLNRLPQMLGMVDLIDKEHGGTVPDTLEALDRLPGLGQYSARSVMCMAFGRPYIMLDPNSYRVATRAWGFVSMKGRPHTDRDLIASLDAEVPKEDPRSFNLALLDIGSQICRQRRPRHDTCPLAKCCKYQKEAHDGCAVRD
jgi:A/G-specific adenine glycosylase